MFHAFCHLLIFFSKSKFSNTITVSYHFDSEKAKHIIGHDLGPICLQWLLEDETSRPKLK